jgi:hypothetical protein
MSASCCGSDATFEGLSADYKRRLWLVIAINAACLLLRWARALSRDRRDALDFAADAATYGISLAVIGAAVKVRTRGSRRRRLAATAVPRIPRAAAQYLRPSSATKYRRLMSTSRASGRCSQCQ